MRHLTYKGVQRVIARFDEVGRRGRMKVFILEDGFQVLPIHFKYGWAHIELWVLFYFIYDGPAIKHLVSKGNPFLAFLPKEENDTGSTYPIPIIGGL